MMRKFHVASLMFAAVCALFAVVASSAFAEELPAEFLAGGAVIVPPIELHFDYQGEVLFEDMKATGGAVDTLCSFLWVVEILEPKNADVLEVLDLEGLSPDLICTFTTAGLCETSMPPLFEAVNLPWLIVPVLIGAAFVLLIQNGGAGVPGYKTVCLTFIGETTDTCEGETGAEAKNGATDLEANFLEANAEITPPGNCSIGGAKEELFNGTGGLITDTDDNSLLSISS